MHLPYKIPLDKRADISYNINHKISDKTRIGKGFYYADRYLRLEKMKKIKQTERNIHKDDN